MLSTARRLGALLSVVLLTASCARPVPASAPPSPSPSRSSSPSSTGPAACPASGLLITAERGEAAMGYREMTLLLRNCGTKPYALSGRPDIVVLDAGHRPLRVAVVASRHFTADPRRRTLAPGTGTMAMLSWRNTVTAADGAVSAPFLSVAPTAGAARQEVTLPAPLDLGTTGRLEASAWL